MLKKLKKILKKNKFQIDYKPGITTVEDIVEQLNNYFKK